MIMIPRDGTNSGTDSGMNRFKSIYDTGVQYAKHHLEDKSTPRRCSYDYYYYYYQHK